MKKIILLLCMSMPLFSWAINYNCQSLLLQPSTKFINHYTAIHGSSTLQMIEAIHRYQQCYQQKTKQIQNVLNKNGQGPLMGALGNFKAFQQALNQFQDDVMPLVATGGTYDQLNAAYIDLYKSKFARVFYQSYLNTAKQKTSNKTLATLKQKFATVLVRFPAAKQQMIKTLFNKMNQAWVLGVNENKLLPYQFALSMLQSAGEEALVQPML